MSSSDAQALVRQLTDNPEVLESMQHMLSLLRANPPKSSHSNSAAPPLTSSQRSTAAVPPGGRPPRTGYEDDTLISASQRQRNYSSHHYNLPSDQESPPRTYSSENLDDGRGSRAYSRAAGTSVPVPHQQQQQHQRQQQHNHHDGAAEDEHGRRTTSASARGTRRSAQHTSATRSGYSAVGSGVGSASQPVESAELAAAQRRIAELEKELQRTAQRVDQLSDVVHRQKDELQEAQDRHALELEETRQAYDAVVRRKDEVQEEALKQLMRSRQLMVSASKYEAVVAAKKREKENALHNSTGGGSGSGAGLTMSATAVNARNTLPGGTSSTSAVKRERPDEADDDDDEYLSAGALKNKNNNNNNYFYTPQQDSPPSKRTASETWGTPVSRGRGRPRRDPQPLQSAQAASAAKSYRKTESPEFITSPTPVGKASTALVGGARTQSRSARKRRTPRTPSLTNADRIAAAAAAAAASSSKRGAPEYSTSFKLDSPTPVVSTTWTAGRSATTSRTPPPPPPPVPLGTAATLSPITRSGQQQQQQGGGGGGGSALTKPPLQQRSAGRLPPPAPAATPQLHIARAVPSTRSGTSSVVQDGPTRSPSPVNPKRGNAGPRRFVFTGLKDDEPQRLARAIAAVGDDGAVVASELDEVPPALTTHIVLRGTPRSVKALCGVVSSKWLVSPEYILNSAESGFWLDEVDEGGMRIFPPPLQGQRFLVTMEHDGIRRKLAQVIEYGGGEVLPVQSGGKVAQDVVVITSGDDLLRYATEGHG